MPVLVTRACAAQALTTAAVVAASLLAGCGAPEPVRPPARPRAAVDAVAEPAVADGPHEISLVADFGPLPDGSGAAVVETTWSIDARGVQRLVIDTPAGPVGRHVMTEGEHWWWLGPEVPELVDGTEWIHFDLAAIARAGGQLPDVVADARARLPHPHEVGVGQLVAGREVVAVEVVDDHEVRLRVSGIERPVVHRRRDLPPGTTFELPPHATDVRDLLDLLPR